MHRPPEKMTNPPRLRHGRARPGHPRLFAAAPPLRHHLFCILASVVCLSGCASLAGVTDPYQRAGTWAPSHANEANLHAMVANPADLVHGRGDDTAIGQTAAAAVERLRVGKVRPLPDSGVAEVKVISSGAPSGYGGGTQ